MRVTSILVGVLVVGGVAAGCMAKQNGTPTVGSDPTGTSTQGETYGAPRVGSPLDATRFLSQPCAVLTQAQLEGFGVSRAGEPDTDSEIARASGPGCLWHARPEVDSTIDVSFLTGNKNGLADTYRGRSRFKFFEETTVEGYPAVFNDPSDGRPHGDCNITVGISDTLAFRAREEGGLVGQAVCDRAKQVAAAVIATLKAGS